jgi:O-antigen ligase
MPNNLKALIVVLVLAGATFWLAKPIGLVFSSRADFTRRVSLWIGLTVVAFLSPSFWLFLLIAAPLLAWAARKDANPVALYLFMLHVIPPLSVNIPVVGIGKLFTLDMYRVLALVILLPAAIMIRRRVAKSSARVIRPMDIFLLLWGALQVLLFVRPDSPDAASMHQSFTNILRSAFLFVLDAAAAYYVISRFCRTPKLIAEAMAAFCLAILVMAPIALFETARHWLLYKEMGQGWGAGFLSGYLLRGGAVRAMVAAGDSLSLGYLFAIAFGFWLYLSRFVQLRALRIGVTVMLLLGLLAAYSRGPWLGALVIFFAYMMLGPRALGRLVKAAMIAAAVLGVLLVSPLGDRITQVIPFMGGQVDNANILYREYLAQRSIQMVEEHPLLGDQDAYSKMQDLRQGVGVIDFVNTYADVAVFYGLVGLGLFLGLILVGLYKTYRSLKAMRRLSPQLAVMGNSVAACIVGTMIMIYTSSFIFGYAQLFYVLAALAAGYVQATVAVERKVRAEARVRTAPAYVPG